MFDWMFGEKGEEWMYFKPKNGKPIWIKNKTFFKYMIVSEKICDFCKGLMERYYQCAPKIKTKKGFKIVL